MKRHKKGIGDDETNLASSINRSSIANDNYTIECKKSTFKILIFSLISSIIIANFCFTNSSLGHNQGFDSTLPISTDVLLLYQKYDLNSDGTIDIDEFEPLALKFLEIKLEHDYDVAISDDDEFITLNAFYEPLDVTKLNSNKYEFLTNSDSIKNLKNWKEPNRPVLNFGCKEFRFLLPQDVDNVKIGQVWDLIPRLKRDSNQLSNKRYNPPEPDHNQIILFRLLQMFHKKPFLMSRFAPQGTSLVLRAKNGNYLDIFFRIHAEFQLNDPPYLPFWFTPAQFNGRLIISKDSSHIEYFNIYVPNEKRLNIDMEWLNDINENMEVDIGYVNRMEIVSSMPSLKSVTNHTENDQVKKIKVSDSLMKPMNQKRYENMIKLIKWDEEIDESEAFSLLERAFYPFKKITYYSFLESFKKAQELNKFVHYILLWGALDDQSC